jgi:peroxiredoxin
VKRLAALLLLAAGCGADPPPPAGEAMIRKGALFPSVEVKDTEGGRVNTAQLLGDGDTMVFFVSFSCETCAELVGAWQGYRESVPEGLTVFGLAEDDPAFARRYLAEHRYPFPVYLDEEGRFAAEYGLEGYPTAVGVAGSRILFIGKGDNHQFTPERAVTMLERMKRSGGEG